MRNCPHCGKKFKTNPALHKHIILSQLDKNEVKNSVVPTQKEMWVIIQKLYKENEIQKKKIEKLEQIVNKYDLPDQSKALRCLLDYAEEKESEWDDMFATIRCNKCD